LTTLTVTRLDDVIGTGDGITLREALEAANSNATVDGITGDTGADLIVFAPNLSGSIQLIHGALQINETVTIKGAATSNTIIDAQKLSRVFEIADTAGNVTFERLDIINGQITTEGEHGGGINSNSTGELQLIYCTVTQNTSAGNGGGISSVGSVTLIKSTISDNSTVLPAEIHPWEVVDGGNGHIYRLVMPSSYQDSFTWTEANAAASASIYQGVNGHLVTINSSDENNFLREKFADQLRHFILPGDGPSDSKWAWIGLFAPTTTADFQWVTGEPVSFTNWANTEPNFKGDPKWQHVHYWTRDDGWTWNNEIDGGYSVEEKHNRYGYIVEYEGPFDAALVTEQRGGGIYAAETVTLVNSTVSGNSAEGPGGGIFSEGDVELTNSTVIDNTSSSAGGGISAQIGLFVNNSIVAQNLDFSGNPDIKSGIGFVSIQSSLIGNNLGTSLIPAPVGTPDSNGNLIGSEVLQIDPLLGPLADNGGPTKTHAILTGSPALDSGNNLLTEPSGLKQWPISEGGNGHFYRMVMPSSHYGSLTWTQAKAAAESSTFQGNQGHLVAVNSSDENNFLFQQFGNQLREFSLPSDGPSYSKYAWIGLFAPTPTSDFQWVTGESTAYTKWAPSEPNFFGQPLWQYGHYWTRDNGWSWNNEQNEGYGVDDHKNRYGYIIEYEGPFSTGISAPLTSDQRGSGFARISGTSVDMGAFELQPPKVDSIGVFRNGGFYLDANNNRVWNKTVGGDLLYSFGAATDTPIVGDWNGDGLTDLGVWRTGKFYIDANANDRWDKTTGGDLLVSFGATTDIPIAGDWNGDGLTDVGTFRAGKFYLDYNGNRKWDGTSGGDQLISFGTTGDYPVIGDWNGDGISDIGIIRNGKFYLDANGNRAWNNLAGGDAYFNFGTTGDKPIAGDWNGDGKSDVGIVRAGVFYLDANGNRAWNNTTGGDARFAFGLATDIPLVGLWTFPTPAPLPGAVPVVPTGPTAASGTASVSNSVPQSPANLIAPSASSMAVSSRKKRIPGEQELVDQLFAESLSVV